MHPADILRWSHGEYYYRKTEKEPAKNEYKNRRKKKFQYWTQTWWFVPIFFAWWLFKCQAHLLCFPLHISWTSLVAQMVKRLPTMRETRVQSLGWEDLLEMEMATHSSIFIWEILWTEEPGGLQSMGSERVRHDWVTHTFTFTYRDESVLELRA